MTKGLKITLSLNAKMSKCPKAQRYGRSFKKGPMATLSLSISLSMNRINKKMLKINFFLGIMEKMKHQVFQNIFRCLSVLKNFCSFVESVHLFDWPFTSNGVIVMNWIVGEEKKKQKKGFLLHKQFWASVKWSVCFEKINRRKRS